MVTFSSLSSSRYRLQDPEHLLESWPAATHQCILCTVAHHRKLVATASTRLDGTLACHSMCLLRSRRAAVHTVQALHTKLRVHCVHPTGMLYTYKIRTRTELPVPTHTQRREMAGLPHRQCMFVNSSRADRWEFRCHRAQAARAVSWMGTCRTLPALRQAKGAAHSNPPIQCGGS